LFYEFSETILDCWSSTLPLPFGFPLYRHFFWRGFSALLSNMTLLDVFLVPLLSCLSLFWLVLRMRFWNCFRSSPDSLPVGECPQQLCYCMNFCPLRFGFFLVYGLVYAPSTARFFGASSLRWSPFEVFDCFWAQRPVAFSVSHLFLFGLFLFPAGLVSFSFSVCSLLSFLSEATCPAFRDIVFAGPFFPVCLLLSMAEAVLNFFFDSPRAASYLQHFVRPERPRLLSLRC